MRLINADELLKDIAELKQSPWFNNIYGYIDRKEAVEIIEDLCIKEAPTIDAVEVVRCKNCKHWKGNDEPIAWNDGNVFVEVPCETKPTDFCSAGKRKEK